MDFKEIFTRFLKGLPIPAQDEKAIRQALKEQVSREFNELANSTMALSLELKKKKGNNEH